jgi:methyltransferase
MSPASATLALIVFTFMAVETRRAARNERAQRARGGIEPPADVYNWMAVAYPASFIAMLAEGVVRGAPPPAAVATGAVLWTFAKALKWWAILTLGPFWTFRVIVVPGATLVSRGPYRFLRHPNYAAVVGELVGVGLMTGAAVTGPLATVAFGALILKRIDIEQRALAAADERRPSDV